MARLTQLEDDIKQKNKSYSSYQDKCNAIRQSEVALSTDNKNMLDAVDAAEDVIRILFNRYKQS